ncbi:hypothetical protein CPB84DRAFT_1854112 [Gymnopilus junonius]|uniref:Uncharacterized protein n=1 Tax=Gymnopilus junonius TaxID=109634 RepID=A0A9P5TF50_GYMJU|nr:hypothetical protein CPB84DRAFT_1854112 [Gymnopilus junonius]
MFFYSETPLEEFFAQPHQGQVAPQTPPPPPQISFGFQEFQQYIPQHKTTSGMVNAREHIILPPLTRKKSWRREGRKTTTPVPMPRIIDDPAMLRRCRRYLARHQPFQDVPTPELPVARLVTGWTVEAVGAEQPRACPDARSPPPLGSLPSSSIHLASQVNAMMHRRSMAGDINPTSGRSDTAIVV